MKRKASSIEHLLTLVKFSPNMIPRNNISPAQAARPRAVRDSVRPFNRQRLPAHERVTNRYLFEGSSMLDSITSVLHQVPELALFLALALLHPGLPQETPLARKTLWYRPKHYY